MGEKNALHQKKYNLLRSFEILAGMSFLEKRY